MEAIVLACAVLEEMLPGYCFSPRWVVRYKPGSPEHARGERFRAMGVSRGVEAVFVRGHVTVSQVARGKVVLENQPAEDEYALRRVDSGRV